VRIDLSVLHDDIELHFTEKIGTPRVKFTMKIEKYYIYNML
jgi:hypothetical protein